MADVGFAAVRINHGPHSSKFSFFLSYNLLPRDFQVLSIFVVVGGVLAVDKQIKLEDIEKDNLKADQQAKYEKQYQAFQQYQAYQQPGLNYQQQPSIAYQPAYQQQQQYVVPSQQYLQQALYQNYQGSNGIAAYQQPAAPSHPFQNYFSQQLQQGNSAPFVMSPDQTTFYLSTRALISWSAKKKKNNSRKA